MEPIHQAPGSNGRTLSELFRDLSSELGTLVRQESELARAEIRDKAAKLGASLAELGAGTFVAFAGFLVLLQAATYGLSRPLQSHALAALIVGGVTLIVGVVLLLRGRSHLKADELAPTRTIRSLRKDATLASSVAQRDPVGRSA